MNLTASIIVSLRIPILIMTKSILSKYYQDKKWIRRHGQEFTAIIFHFKVFLWLLIIPKMNK